MRFRETFGVLISSMTTEAPPPDNLTYHSFSEAELGVMYCGYAVVTLLAICGNGLVMVVIGWRRKLQSIANMFIWNLACADCLTGLLAIPFKFTAAMMQHWVFPGVLCHVVPFMETTTLSVSVFTLLVISVDRLRLMVNRANTNMPKQVAHGLILAIWLVGVACSLPYGWFHVLIPMGNATNGTQLFRCSPVDYTKHSRVWKGYNVYLTIIQYFVPVIIVDLIYGYIAYKVWSTQPVAPGKDADNFTKSKIKVSALEDS